MIVTRRDIIYVGVDGAVGSEQDGDRPAIVIQNDIGNKYSPTIIVAFATGSVTKTRLPTHVVAHKEDVVFDNAISEAKFKNSTILLEQVRTIDKKRIKPGKVGRLSEEKMREVDMALAISIGLTIAI